jgi:signal transduction histidine kinase
LAKKLEKTENGGLAENSASVKELNIIEQNVRLCRDLLNMWQSYGSVEALPNKLISVSGIVREVIKGVGGLAAQSGVELKAEICEEPCTLVGDSVQISRAIQNVIINAIQASGETKSSVSVQCTPMDFYVDIRIQDFGHGINPAQMNKIFDPYFTTKQGKSGTGLGLYITKKVVEDHNGSIKVDSQPEVGTTFTIRLPLVNN